MSYETKLACREHMADRGPHAPAPKVSRPKTKPQENPSKQKLAKTAPLLEPRVVVVKPVDQLEEQVLLHPPNQPDQLPDIPPNQPDQLPNNPPNQPNPQANPPNQQQNSPADQPNQPNPPNPPANPSNPMQEQNLPPHVQQLNWSYFKPEFSGKTRGRCSSTSAEDE